MKTGRRRGADARLFFQEATVVLLRLLLSTFAPFFFSGKDIRNSLVEWLSSAHMTPHKEHVELPELIRPQAAATSGPRLVLSRVVAENNRQTDDLKPNKWVPTWT